MKKNQIIWNEDGWALIQEADPDKHILEVSYRAENGTVVEVRIRHSRGEQEKGSATIDNKNILPMPLGDFKKAFLKGKIDFR